MKKFTETFLLALIGFALATTVKADTLNITIADIPDDSGKIMVSVTASEAAFKGDKPPIMQFILPARAGELSFSTDALASGEYGVQVMHDQNGNEELDANFVGIPKEPWGFSNDATGNFGPPDWQAVKFTVEGDTTTTIHLNK